MITLALAQTEHSSDSALNLITLIRLSEKAARLGCAAVCFPEAFVTGYLPDEAKAVAIERSCDIIEKVGSTAKQLGIDILTGFIERCGNSLFITHAAFLKNGEACFYRKTHLGQRESEVFSSGEKLECFTLSCGIKAAFQLCVETHFAQITQTLSLQGAQVVFAPHAVPCSAGSRERIWGKYIPARSYDNRLYFACCNYSGERFGGGCMVTAPDGEVIASKFDAAEGLVTFEVDTELLARYHTKQPSHRYRYYPAMLKKELCR